MRVNVFNNVRRNRFVTHWCRDGVSEMTDYTQIENFENRLLNKQEWRLLFF